MSIFVLLKYLFWLCSHFVSFLFNNVLFTLSFPQDSRRRFSVGIRSVEVEKPRLKMNKEET
jgi:hypothetical protein